jgi:hypothetical protein
MGIQEILLGLNSFSRFKRFNIFSNFLFINFFSFFCSKLSLRSTLIFLIKK